MRRSRKSNIYFQNCRHLAFRWQFRSFIFGKTSRVFCFASSCCVAVLFSSPQERSGPFHLIQNWRATGPLELKHAQLADPSWIWRNRAGRLKKNKQTRKTKNKKRFAGPCIVGCVSCRRNAWNQTPARIKLLASMSSLTGKTPSYHHMARWFTAFCSSLLCLVSSCFEILRANDRVGVQTDCFRHSCAVYALPCWLQPLQSGRIMVSGPQTRTNWSSSRLFVFLAVQRNQKYKIPADILPSLSLSLSLSLSHTHTHALSHFLGRFRTFQDSQFIPGSQLPFFLFFFFFSFSCLRYLETFGSKLSESM